MRWAPEGVKVRNPAFDVTPAELITGIVCEKGVVREPSRERLQALISTGV
jgi:methylthioribose-1-phosphate isomerase